MGPKDVLAPRLPASAAAVAALVASLAAGGRLGAGQAKIEPVKPGMKFAKEAKARPGPAVPEAAVARAVGAGLRWLARHQDADGGWSSAKFDANCGGAKCSGPASGTTHDLGATSLAVLAFLGAGHLPSSPASIEDPVRKGRKIRYGDVVTGGLKHIREAQDGDGCFGKQEGEFVYDHALAVLAVAQAARLAKSAGDLECARRGVAFLLAARNPDLAWRYSVRPGDNDTSITGWCVRALKAAEAAGIQVDPAAYGGVRKWLAKVTNPEGRTGYEAPGDMGSILVGVNDKWRGYPAMTAVAVDLRVEMDGRKDQAARKGADVLGKSLPDWHEPKNSNDSYYCHYGTLALFRLDGPSGPYWQMFSQSVRKGLIAAQEATPADGEPACDDGSWDPSTDKWGVVAGRVYTTAINVLTLEIGPKGAGKP